MRSARERTSAYSAATNTAFSPMRTTTASSSRTVIASGAAGYFEVGRDRRAFAGRAEASSGSDGSRAVSMVMAPAVTPPLGVRKLRYDSVADAHGRRRAELEPGRRLGQAEIGRMQDDRLRRPLRDRRD